jgi:hypothetical protein
MTVFYTQQFKKSRGIVAFGEIFSKYSAEKISSTASFPVK